MTKTRIGGGIAPLFRTRAETRSPRVPMRWLSSEVPAPRGRRLTARDGPGAPAQGGLRVADQPEDDLPCRLDGIDQAGVLADEERGLLDVAGLESPPHCRADLAAVGAELAFPSRPAADQTVADDAGIGSRPHASARHVRDLGQDRIV